MQTVSREPKYEIGQEVWADKYGKLVKIKTIIDNGQKEIMYTFEVTPNGSIGSSFESEISAGHPKDLEPKKPKAKPKKDIKAGTDIVTGSLRYNSGKPDCHHIHPKFVIALADLMTESAKKYETYNYMKGQPYSVPYNSMMRHLQAFMDSEDYDKESGKSHLLHVAANAMIMWVTQNYQIEKYPSLDDRYKKVLGLDK